MRNVSIGNMIKQLSGMVGTRDLTSWQEDFVRSIASQSNDGTDTSPLSDKQVEIIDEIFHKHFV